jgi:sugar phosphate isomerase/epimerase
MTWILRSSIPGFREMNTAAALRATAAHGLAGTLFSSLAEISPTLDASELRSARDLAGELGIGIGASVDWINPLTERGRSNAIYGDGDLTAGLTRLIGAAGDIGIRDLFFMVGKIEDRFDPTVEWRAQLDAVASILFKLAPMLRDAGSRLLLKTHEEITSFEVARLVERVGPDLLGVALDPVNVLCRIEDPVEATRRVAPYVAQVHVDDAVLCFENGGIRRFLCPLGDGVIDWGGILALVPAARRVLEFHSGQFAMPVFDPAWRRAQPDLTLDEFASILHAAATLSRDFVPSDQANSTGRLAPALGYVRSGLQ